MCANITFAYFPKISAAVYFRFADQIFSYLIVIDFESTCWREKNNYSQEISKSSFL